MAITDLAGNALTPAGATGQVLGYTEPPAPEEVLPLDMYYFLIEPIRRKDEEEGALFVRRLLQGPQELWRATQAKIFQIKDLWSIIDCPDEFLIYQARIVGWTPDLQFIVEALDVKTLRRLIASSVRIWKTRGPEDSIRNILRLVFGKRSRVWNYFDYQWILGETELSEDHLGRDSWIIQAPDREELDENVFTVRLVDPGSANRELVRNIVNLMRPAGETIEVVYLMFLDVFETDGDNYQWATETSSKVIVDGGSLILAELLTEEEAFVDLEGALDWSTYVIGSRLSGWASSGANQEFGLRFYRTDADNYYEAALDIAINRLTLRKVVAGTPATIATHDFDHEFLDLMSYEYYYLRVEVFPDGSTNRFRIFVDNMKYIEATDSEFGRGAPAVFHGPDTFAKFDEVELLPIPATVDVVGLNYGQ